MSMVTLAAANNFSKLDVDYWADVAQEDTLTSLQFDADVWSETFVPPPPRPTFLEDIVYDGITPCDLCVWAWKESKTLNSAADAPQELGWLFCLVIVSVISALIGAIVMTAILRCKRIKNCHSNDAPRPRARSSNASIAPQVKCITVSERFASQSYHPSDCNFWTWCSRKEGPSQSQLEVPTSPTENHYTHIDETHTSPPSESIYTELDNDSPSYQNASSINAASDVPGSPSSSYYSDLSAMGSSSERGYEVVGLSKLTQMHSNARPPIDIPSANGVSDYI